VYWNTWKLRRFLEKAPGFLMGKLLADRNRAFWTMSMWQDTDSMRAFRNSKVHAGIMPNAARWCDEASVIHWETQAEELPTWDEAHRRMSESGKPAAVKMPSADYKARRYKEPYISNYNCLVILPRN
jgi:Domain of unknown function (DUF3291)